MYAIDWITKTTDYKGQGQFIFKTREAAQKVCDELNIEYRDIRHGVIEEAVK